MNVNWTTDHLIWAGQMSSGHYLQDRGYKIVVQVSWLSGCP